LTYKAMKHAVLTYKAMRRMRTTTRSTTAAPTTNAAEQVIPGYYVSHDASPSANCNQVLIKKDSNIT